MNIFGLGRKKQEPTSPGGIEGQPVNNYGGLVPTPQTAEMPTSPIVSQTVEATTNQPTTEAPATTTSLEATQAQVVLPSAEATQPENHDSLNAGSESLPTAAAEVIVPANLPTAESQTQPPVIDKSKDSTSVNAALFDARQQEKTPSSSTVETAPVGSTGGVASPDAEVDTGHSLPKAAFIIDNTSGSENTGQTPVTTDVSTEQADEPVTEIVPPTPAPENTTAELAATDADSEISQPKPAVETSGASPLNVSNETSDQETPPSTSTTQQLSETPVLPEVSTTETDVKPFDASSLDTKQEMATTPVAEAKPAEDPLVEEAIPVVSDHINPLDASASKTESYDMTDRSEANDMATSSPAEKTNDTNTDDQAPTVAGGTTALTPAGETSSPTSIVSTENPLENLEETKSPVSEATTAVTPDTESQSDVTEAPVTPITATELTQEETPIAPPVTESVGLNEVIAPKNEEDEEGTPTSPSETTIVEASQPELQDDTLATPSVPTSIPEVATEQNPPQTLIPAVDTQSSEETTSQADATDNISQFKTPAEELPEAA